MTPDEQREFTALKDSLAMQLARKQATELLLTLEAEILSPKLSPDNLRLVQGKIIGVTAMRNLLGGAFLGPVLGTKPQDASAKKPIVVHPMIRTTKESPPSTRS